MHFDVTRKGVMESTHRMSRRSKRLSAIVQTCQTHRLKLQDLQLVVELLELPIQVVDLPPLIEPVS